MSKLKPSLAVEAAVVVVAQVAEAAAVVHEQAADFRPRQRLLRGRLHLLPDRLLPVRHLGRPVLLRLVRRDQLEVQWQERQAPVFARAVRGQQHPLLVHVRAARGPTLPVVAVRRPTN